MNDDDTFRRLIQELSPGERESLLQNVRSQLTLNGDPLYVDKNLSSIQTEEGYARLPWYYHLVFFILSLFAVKPPLKLYQDREIAKLGRIINTRAPRFYDYSRNLLLPEFYKALVDLKESARFFFNALNVSVGQDRAAFYVFLGSLEMEDIHNRLVRETDPVTLAKQNPGKLPVELRRIAYRKMEDAVDLIHEDQRTAMYEDIRSLYCLKQLASFLFDRLIMAFNQDASAAGMTCSVLTVKELLSNLNNILYSFREIPSMSLFESLFVFMLQEKMKEPGFDANEEIQKLLAKAERSLAAIRKFNQMTPLTLIIRCASRDLSLSPVLIGGGEDWLAVYRDYWKQLIKDQFTRYLRTTRSLELQGSFQSFFKGINLKLLENAESGTNPDGIPVKEVLSLSFLRTYHAVVFTGDSAAILNAILINGEFQNRDNQLEFSLCYNELNKLGTIIDAFDGRLSPSGDFGSRYTAVREELISLTFKRRKVQGVMDEVTLAAGEIIDRSKAALIMMVNVLNGILKKDPVSKYDTLSNFSVLAGKGTAFTDGLFTAVNNTRIALTLLDEIRSLETEKDE
ncbi:MAG: DUF5312 domain-containing protein [Treponema sp.]|jgi:hypothetical protein|nr:DUF5312 domain-containing protein [Treponema sp.]